MSRCPSSTRTPCRPYGSERPRAFRRPQLPWAVVSAGPEPQRPDRPAARPRHHPDRSERPRHVPLQLRPNVDHGHPGSHPEHLSRSRPGSPVPGVHPVGRRSRAVAGSRASGHSRAPRLPTRPTEPGRWRQPGKRPTFTADPLQRVLIRRRSLIGQDMARRRCAAARPSRLAHAETSMAGSGDKRAR